MPHVAKIAVVTVRARRRVSMRGGGGEEWSARTVAGDGAVADNDRHGKAALADDLREERVLDALLLALLRAGGAEELERAKAPGQLARIEGQAVDAY